MDDCMLIARMAAGDQSAAGELYDRYGHHVYALAFHMLHDGPAAEQVTQAVFVKLWRTAVHFDPQRGRAGAWVLHTAYTTAAELLRTRHRAKPSRYEPAIREAAATHALEMAYFEALSQPDIAGRLGIPLRSVKVRVRLAIDSLRQWFTAPRRKEVERRVQLPPG